jgi:uncharacterized protein YnzC (UPF0291/DUF896 family)
MLDERIARLNELTKKASCGELTAEETQERAQLRREYIDAFRASLTAQLDNTYILDEHGNKRKLQRRGS